ncbi:hypothetical protein SAMN04488567_0684 [Limimaricola pyoseonensis]|uniref:Uncharacterized protein n=2 Tax=Limimaricola pyoseonensis TaxID=521013 RepID=A0A1G6ZWR5_9RHOB|nr:hypothetical protein [Limimaricola pyoseonensis]SDE06285.1 hypothetical protein SAMN04488567_0684 [Limimaricola pyoseonensis]
MALAGAAGAQQADPGEPLSAIDWLSQSVAAPSEPAAEPPTADSASSPAVSVRPLDGPSPDAVGLLAPAVSGLPRHLWSASSTESLTELIAALGIDGLPATQELLRRLMIAEADAPADADGHGRLFLARIDRLLEMGALEPALAMLAESRPAAAPERFRRWFDAALLTGTENEACAAMKDRPALAPTLHARIFCLARGGDWQAAALTLNSARALGEVSDEDDAMLSRFLDPDLYEGEPDLPQPERATPLGYRLREAVGEALPAATLPRAFSHADLRPNKAWRAQIEAAERLARHGAIQPAQLFGIYAARVPAASGGIWDRATAIQALDAALAANDRDAIAETLSSAWSAMRDARLETAFAEHYAERLAALDLEGEAARQVFEIALLGPGYEEAALAPPDDGPETSLLAAVARGDVSQVQADGPRALAVVEGFSDRQPPEVLTELIDAGRPGEAALRAIALVDQGATGDPAALSDGLAALRALGLEATARRAALQYLLLETGA